MGQTVPFTGLLWTAGCGERNLLCQMSRPPQSEETERLPRSLATFAQKDLPRLMGACLGFVGSGWKGLQLWGTGVNP